VREREREYDTSPLGINIGVLEICHYCFGELRVCHEIYVRTGT
jgi:hypothetical protein